MKQGVREFSDILLILITVFSIIPSIGLVFNTFGFHWTAYRIVVVFAFVLSLLIRNGQIKLQPKAFTERIAAILLFWVLYGLVLLIISEYSNKHGGLVELLSISYAFLVLVTIRIIGISESKVNIVKSTIIFVFCFLLVFAFVEIITGDHLPTSIFNDPQIPVDRFPSHHLATGFSYNPNDFSAMLTCLFPIVFIFGKTALKWVCLLGVITINLINDATICNIAIIVSLLLYYVTLNSVPKGRLILRRLVLIVAIVLIILFFLYGQSFLVKRDDFLGTISRQLFYAQRGTGSLYNRAIIYRDSIAAWSQGGFFGFGPASFTNYFTVWSSKSGLVNPHSLWIELLFQYGIIIAILYIGFLINLIIKSRKLYLSRNRSRNSKYYIMIVLVIIIYFIVAFAPSAFLSYPYQWLLVAFCCMILDVKGDNDKFSI